MVKNTYIKTLRYISKKCLLGEMCVPVCELREKKKGAEATKKMTDKTRRGEKKKRKIISRMLSSQNERSSELHS